MYFLTEPEISFIINLNLFGKSNVP